MQVGIHWEIGATPYNKIGTPIYEFVPDPQPREEPTADTVSVATSAQGSDIAGIVSQQTLINMNSSDDQSEIYLRVPGDPTEYWTQRAKEAFKYSTDGTAQLSATGEEFGPGNSKCNIFLANNLYKDYNDWYIAHGYTNKSANDLAIDWMSDPKFERITAQTSLGVIAAALEYADKGYLVVLAYYNPTGSGHVGFIGTSSMVYNTIGEVGKRFNGEKTNSIDGFWSIVIQAGAYPGAAPLNYATNELDKQIDGDGLPTLDSDKALLRFYRVKIK